MKFISISLCSFLLLAITSCGKIENESQNSEEFALTERASSDSVQDCTYQLDLHHETSGLDQEGNPCDITITFVLMLENGETTEYSYKPSEDPLPSFTLPANATFSLWIKDGSGSQSSFCGEYSWVLNLEDTSCGLLTEEIVDERLEISSLEHPEYIIETKPKLNGECRCPIVNQQ